MTTSEKAAWAAMIGLAVLGGLLLVAIALGSAAGDAVEQALAEPMAQSTQRSTQVCVGLFNLGACRNTQTSTSTAITPKNKDNGVRKDLLALESEPAQDETLLTVDIMAAYDLIARRERAAGGA